MNVADAVATFKAMVKFYDDAFLSRELQRARARPGDAGHWLLVLEEEETERRRK